MKMAGIVVLVVVVGAAAFFGGVAYSAASGTGDVSSGDQVRMRPMDGSGLTGEPPEEMAEGMAEGMAAGRQAGSRPGALEGSVLAIDAESLTIELEAGGSQTVYLSAETITAFAEGSSATAVQQGDTVLVMGEPSGDGIVMARAIVVE